MPLSHTMRSTKSLIILFLLAICVQNIKCKNVEHVNDLKPADVLLVKTPLATRDRDLRALRDVWEQIKSSAISSWNFLKRIAQNTRDNISKWANSAREYAIKVEKSFEEQLQTLQNRLSNIITDLLGTSKHVQECLQLEGKNIQDGLKEIYKKMSECVSNQIKQLTQIKGKQAKLNVNDTLFITDLDNKHDACKIDKVNYEECLDTVRELVYDKIEELDGDIQKTSIESRGLADDIKNSLASCSLQNLADASSYLTSEIMEVVRCVLDGNINQAIVE